MRSSRIHNLPPWQYANSAVQIWIISYVLHILTEWFQQQTEFTTDFETMEVKEINKCLSKFSGLSREERRNLLQEKLSDVRANGSRSPSEVTALYNYIKNFSIFDDYLLISKGNKTINSYKPVRQREKNSRNSPQKSIIKQWNRPRLCKIPWGFNRLQFKLEISYWTHRSQNK